jgi:hypothetical protein
MPREKQPISWQQIVGTVVLAIIMGAIGFFGATLKSAIDKSSDNEKEILLIKKDVQTVLKDLQNTIGEMGDISATVKSLEITTTKLETIVDRMGR